MCVACLEPVATRQAVALADPDDDFERKREEVWNYLLSRNAESPNPLPTCPQCGRLFHPEERGYLRTDRCDTCQARWFDKIVYRLIRRHGRKHALRILKRLAK